MSLERADYIELCDIRGICPDCGDSVVECRCEEDHALHLEILAHPKGCLCCADDIDLDAEHDRAPVRVRFPPVRRQVAA
jgi:hypothetical protein